MATAYKSPMQLVTVTNRSLQEKGMWKFAAEVDDSLNSNTYINQSIENSKPIFAVGMLTMPHIIIKTTIEALGTPGDDIVPNMPTTLENWEFLLQIETKIIISP